MTQKQCWNKIAQMIQAKGINISTKMLHKISNVKTNLSHNKGL